MKPLRPASILITDDERNIRMMVRTALEAEDYTVREASNGREALEAMRVAPPDLVVLDLNMPHLDGMAVLEEMKTFAESLRPRVIVLTAYGSVEAAVKAVRLGASDFVEKPLAPSDLRRTVKGVLNEPDIDRGALAPMVLDSYDRALDRIRRLLRLTELADAETLLMKVADRRSRDGAEYFNLLGVLYETQAKWRLARKCYGKALDADTHYKPAQANLQRLAELRSFGQTTRGVELGDESDDVLYARLPQAT